jgi:hypothetical protein
MKIWGTERCSWYRQLASTRLPVVLDADVACCLSSRRSLDATCLGYASVAITTAGAADAS